MNVDFMQQLQIKPRGRRELKDIIRRFETKWQRKATGSVKSQQYWVKY